LGIACSILSVMCVPAFIKMVAILKPQIAEGWIFLAVLVF
jgi:hypothetical protein